MENNSIGQYRSHDAPKNFAVKVSFWKVTAGSVIPSVRFNPTVEVAEEVHELGERKNVDSEKEEAFIYWQKKLFSAKEFDLYSDPLNCLTTSEQKYHEDVNYIRSNHGDRENRRIFTYIDSDANILLNELNQMTLSPEEHQSALDEKISTMKNYSGIRKPTLTAGHLKRRHIVTTEPTQAMKSNRVISTLVKTMKIMADVSSVNSNGVKIEDERVLCTVKINANGLIVIQPDIEINETYTIETYHETRNIYHYKLEHASIPMSKEESSQETRLFNELYNRHAQLMGSQVGTEMVLMPRINELFVHSFCEIVSAKDYEYDGLYVTFTLDLPDGWYADDVDRLSGVTQRCTMNSNGVANFSFPFDLHLTHTWDEENPPKFIKWPTLLFEVYSLDSWQRHRIEGYGYCQLPDVPGTTCVEIDTWRPKGESSADEMQRFFIGGTPELDNLAHVKDLGGNDEKVNKFYFKTVTTGSIVLRMNTVIHTKLDEKAITSTERFTKWKKTIKRTGGFAAAVDSLTQVLASLKLCQKHSKPRTLV